MSSFNFLLILALFLKCVNSRMQFDLYHDNTHYKNDMLQNCVNNKSCDQVGLLKPFTGEYYGLIKVGKPAKEFKVIFDTVWADSWLPSEHCAYREFACMLHTRYDSLKSSTYQENGAKWMRGDTKESFEGFLSVDDFHLPHMKLANQTFIEMTHIPNIPYVALKADGVIGLAFDSLATAGVKPFFYNMISQKLVAESVFTFYMNRDSTINKAGNLILGGTDRSHINTTLTYVRVTKKEYWTVRLNNVIVTNANESHTFCANGCDAKIDTSSNGIYGPPAEIEKINNLLGAKSVLNFWPYKYMVDCRTFAKLPQVVFSLSGKNFTIESKYYIQKMVTMGFTVCLSPFTPNPESNTWRLGGAFLMQHYIEFDLDNGRIAIAPSIF